MRSRLYRRRRGLAPLEFVLWLPILLFVAALMVNYGTMAAWRVRGEAVSRHAVWRTRWPRSGRFEAPPRPLWPRDAEMTFEADAPLVQLDDPVIDHPVVRGPLPNNFIVHPILDPDRVGALQGVSEVDRPYPLLPRLGVYNSGDVDTPLLDLKWQANQMGIPNIYRRIKILYELPRTSPALPRAFRSAVQSARNIPHAQWLAVLERDPDVLRYTGRYVDFHPRVDRDCELDEDRVYREHVRPLVDIRLANGNIRLGEITTLPRRMTSFYLSMYRRALRRLEAELNGRPPPSPRRRAEIEAEIAELERKIEQLEAYQERLPEIEDALRRAADAALP